VRAIDLVSGRRPKASEERTRGRVPSARQAGLDGSLVGPITEFVPDSPLEGGVSCEPVSESRKSARSFALFGI
jgi:hypothetical protein